MDAIRDKSYYLSEEIVRLQKIILCLVLMFLLLGESCAIKNNISATPSHIGTSELNSGVTPRRTPTITPIFTATQLLSSTAIPTLPVEDARLKLLNFLASNGNCYLPCLWGITPGKSTFQEAQSILEPLTSISGFTAFESSVGAIDPNYAEGDLGIYTNIRFRADPNNNIVGSISFHAQALQEISQGNYEELFGDPLYDRLLETYSLPRILTIYGPPADILIRTNSELPPQNWGPFEILLSYPERGILVHYTIPMNPVGPNIVGCPEKSRLELKLMASGNINSTDKLLELLSAPAKVEEVFPGYQPIEEVTSLSLELFVKKYSQPTDNCIETPANYWPAP